MSDFKAKMQQIRFQLGLHPRPCYVNIDRGKAGRAGLERGGGEVHLPHSKFLDPPLL